MFRKKGLSFRRKNRTWAWVLAAAGAIAALVCLFIFVFAPLLEKRNSIKESESRLTANENSDNPDMETTRYDGTFYLADEDDENESGEELELRTTTEPETTTTLSEEEIRDRKVKEIIAGMTLEEKVYQLFIVTPEDITGKTKVTEAGEEMRDALTSYPVGGMVYYRQNFSDIDGTKELVKNITEYSIEVEGLPIFQMIMENGGSSGRLSGFFDIESHGSMIYAEDVEKSRKLGEYIGSYLSDFGFNVNLAPNTAGLSSEVVDALGEGLMSEGILCCYRNFPGDKTGTLTAYEGHPYSQEGFEELKAGNMAPFLSMDAEKVPFVMASHICIPYITNDRVPTCLSYKMVTEVLKETLGYNGIVITSTLCNDAVRKAWGYNETSYLAIQAGCDMIFEPTDIKGAADTIISHIQAGDITEERIEQSLYKIISLKLKMIEG